jgi:hypothetical protein
MTFTRQRIVLGAIGVVVIALMGVAIAATGDQTKRPRAASSDGSTSTSKLATSSAVSSTTTATAIASTTTPGFAPARSLPPTESAPDPTTAAPTGTEPSTTVPSPLPPGTLLGWAHLTQQIEFPNAPVPLGVPIAYNASITNPNDQWVFENEGCTFGVNLYVDAVKDEYMTPMVLAAKRDTSPEFHHNTPAGDLQGLLLAPHSSYTFSGTITPRIESEGVTDNTINVTIVPQICTNIWGVRHFPGPTGVVTIIPAPATTTTASG